MNQSLCFTSNTTYKQFTTTFFVTVFTSMAATRLLLRTSNKPLYNFVHSSSSSSSCTTTTNVKFSVPKCAFTDGRRGVCSTTGDECLEEKKKKKRPCFEVKATSAIVGSDTIVVTSIVLANLIARTIDAAFRSSLMTFKWRLRRFKPQMFIENAIVNCRFFTFFAVAGSLLGSVLCFVEGVFMVVESYVQYFHALSQRSDQGHVVQLLIEAIDMFLVGTAMLVFATSLYVMFIGPKSVKERALGLPTSNFFGLFSLKTLPTWVEQQSVSQAKSKIGHAVMMILQVGLLEKFKSVPLVTGLDLACFAASVLLSSGCIFVLSKLSFSNSIEEVVA